MALIHYLVLKALLRLPQGPPALQTPTPCHMSKAFLSAIRTQKLKKFLDNDARRAMLPSLFEMATTHTVPSLGAVTDEEFSHLPIEQQTAVSGYGSIETIGVRGVHSFGSIH